ncbi:response regulator [Pedobacter caeni]|uniref:Two component transcriptional regulator, LuxR family n=1 Tax=Pedobacter caeni TaxID=288992 RepID=A0A1M4YU06_9SPHI|nr:response regulator transcription factor [Pedobacter caeni]SHF09324.1 two component transcriptional regulator, LuxR family [Pedobacter caeni]
MKISIVLADDHPAILEGIQAYLSKDERFNIIDSVTNGLALLRSESLQHADLILLDLNMPGLDGLKTLDELKSKSLKAKIIIMTNYNSPELVKDCRLKGASGYVIKSDKLEQLSGIILKVLEGKPYFPVLEEDKTDAASFSYFDDFLKKHKLTKREVEIIRLVCQNMRTREIAERLYLSEFTIHTHRKNIMRKLEIGDSTVALYDFAIKNKLIMS